MTSTTKLTQPGQSHQATYGVLTLVASITVDGGYAINTFAGPTRIHELSGLRFSNRLDAFEVYRDIRDGGLARMSLADIAETVRERLVGIAAGLRGRPGMDVRVAGLDAALDVVEPLAFRSGPVDTPVPVRTFRQLRDLHAAGIARQRAEAVA